MYRFAIVVLLFWFLDDGINTFRYLSTPLQQNVYSKNIITRLHMSFIGHVIILFRAFFVFLRISVFESVIDSFHFSKIKQRCGRESKLPAGDLIQNTIFF